MAFGAGEIEATPLEEMAHLITPTTQFMIGHYKFVPGQSDNRASGCASHRITGSMTVGYVSGSRLTKDDDYFPKICGVAESNSINTGEGTGDGRRRNTAIPPRD